MSLVPKMAERIVRLENSLHACVAVLNALGAHVPSHLYMQAIDARIAGQMALEDHGVVMALAAAVPAEIAEGVK